MRQFASVGLIANAALGVGVVVCNGDGAIMYRIVVLAAPSPCRVCIRRMQAMSGFAALPLSLLSLLSLLLLLRLPS
jgi:hypothetical protein